MAAWVKLAENRPGAAFVVLARPGKQGRRLRYRSRRHDTLASTAGAKARTKGYWTTLTARRFWAQEVSFEPSTAGRSLP